MGEKLWIHGGECSNRGAVGKVERFPHRGPVPTSIHQPERLVCSPTGAGGGWELRLRLRRQETIVTGCTKRGDSEHCLKELQRWAQAVAISMDTRDGHEMLRLLLQPPRSLCVSTGHSPHLPSQEPVQTATARVP